MRKVFHNTPDGRWGGSQFVEDEPGNQDNVSTGKDLAKKPSAYIRKFCVFRAAEYGRIDIDPDGTH